MLGCINEIGNKQKADYLTGLLNEYSLKDYLENEKQPNYILRLGIDDFKEVNEKLGIEYGDYVLKEISEIIYNCLKDQYVYKVRSDEFIILDFNDNIETIKKLYHYIKSAINKFVVKNHYEAIFTISGGIVKYTSYDEMMKYSEFALNEAKKQGKNRYYEFNKNDYELFIRKKKITGYLSEAISHSLTGFDVFYQPLYSQDNELYGAEALLRFSCEEYGSISPIEFIPILEETGLILIVGKWVIYQATKTCKNIQKYIPDFKVSINFSNKQLTHSNIVDDVLRFAKKNHLDPKYIIVEFTESGIIETQNYYCNIWEKLKENHINIALDDFGTGYSNFHYLNELKPDIVKIDYGFTHESILNNQKFKMLSLLCDMINNLNIKICIEGIENEHEEECMKKIAYDYNQGYYYGKPCSYDDFLKNNIKTEL
jgi:diguanylate cyclase (GGDEF)-like protein